MENQNNPSIQAPIDPVTASTQSKLPFVPIVIVTILLFTVGIGSYYLGTKQTKTQLDNVPTPTTVVNQIPAITATTYPTQTIVIPEKIAGWKTYENNEGLFSLKMPRHWKTTLCNDFTNDQFPEAVLNIDLKGEKTPCGMGGNTDIQIKFYSEANAKAEMNGLQESFNTELNNITIENSNTSKLKLLSPKNPNMIIGPAGDQSGRVFYYIEHKPRIKSDEYPVMVIYISNEDEDIQTFISTLKFLR